MIYRRHALLSLLLLVAGLGTAHSQITWSRLNQPFGGTVYTFINHNGTLIAGSAEGVNLYSNDSGKTWTTRVEPGYVTFSDGTTLYASGGEGGPVYISSNHGTTWVPTDSALSTAYYTIVNDAGHLFTLSEGESFRSTDGGGSWIRISENELTLLYLNENGTLFGLYEQGVLRSTDEGDTWTFSDIRDSINNTAALRFTPSGGILLLTDNGVLASDDDGVSFEPLGMEGTDLALQLGNSFFPDGSFLASTREGTLLRIAADASSSEVVDGPIGTLITTEVVDDQHFLISLEREGIWLTEDGGQTWTQKGIAGVADVRSVVELRDGSLAALTRQGIYRSVNDGTTWNLLSLTRRLPTFVVLTTTGKLIAGSYFGELAMSFVDGTNLEYTSPFDGAEIVSGITNANGTLLVSTYNTIYRSTNDGDTWSIVMERGVQDFDTLSDGRFVVASGNSLYVSDDDGLTFTEVSDIGNITHIYSIAVDAEDIIYLDVDIGSERMLVWTSADGSETDHQDYPCDLLQGGHLTGYRGLPFVIGYCGIYVSQDRGASWTKVGENPESDPPTSFLYSSNGYVFANGNDGGIYRGLLSISSVPATHVPDDLEVTTAWQSDRLLLNFRTHAATTASLCLTNVSGQTVRRVEPVRFESGLTLLPVATDGLPSGKYFLVVSGEGWQRSIPVSILR